MSTVYPLPVNAEPSYSQSKIYEIKVLGNSKNNPNPKDIEEHTYEVLSKPLSIDDARKIAKYDFEAISYIEVVEVVTTRYLVKYPLDYSN